MGSNPTVFPTPSPELSDLTNQAALIEAAINSRASLLSQAQTLTLQIRELRDAAEDLLNTEGMFVDGIAKGDPAIIKSAGMDVSDDTHTVVGTMPKVTGLVATQGDADGEIDAHWNPVKRGLSNYTVEITEGPAGQTGWHFH